MLKSSYFFGFKIRIVLLILLFATNAGASSYTYYGEKKPVSKPVLNKIAELYELIVTDIDQAALEIDSLKKVVERKDNAELIIDVLMLEAEMYRSKGDFIHMKLALYQGISWKNEEISEYHNLLLDYYQSMNEASSKNTKTQLKLLLKVNRLAKKKGYPFLEARSEHALGKYYIDQEKYYTGQEHLKKAGKLFLDQGYRILEYNVNISKGIGYFWEGEYNRSLTFFHQTKEIAEKENYTKCYLNSLLNLGEAHLYIVNHEDSAKYYFDLFLQNRNLADIRDVFQCYWAMEQYHKLRNETALAYHYSSLMHDTENKIRDQMNDATNFEIDQVFKKLQNERKLRDSANEEKSLKLIFGLIGLFFLALLLIMWRVLKEKNRYNFVLMAQKDDIIHKKKMLDLALKEKELLLKEIHHRVKNNLQIISSLLSLQTKNIDDEAARNAILEGKERIQAIALIHQKLYQDDTFASIEMKDYLGDLIEQLSNSYNLSSDKIKLSLQTNDIILNIDSVVPLGLIICELTTNAFKYAFSDKTIGGKLKIEISRIDHDFYMLHVKDNGAGMLENFDFLGSNTLGVEIISALTEQLEGELSYKTGEKGTSIRIKFREIKN